VTEKEGKGTEGEWNWMGGDREKGFCSSKNSFKKPCLQLTI